MTLLKAPQYGPTILTKTFTPNSGTGQIEVADAADVAALIALGYTQVSAPPPPPTGVLPPAGYTGAHLLFEDRFTTSLLDTTKWNPWLGDAQYGRWGNRGALASPFSGPNMPHAFNLQCHNPHPYGYAPGTIDRLTGGIGVLSIIGSPSTLISPYTWETAAISSYGKMELPVGGGYIQVRAKMPDSRYGAWGGLWMMATGGREIDLQESGYIKGSTPVNQVQSSGFHPAAGTQQVLTDIGVDLTADYHLYGCEFRPGQSVKIYVDGAVVATFTSGVPTGVKYELIIDLEIAGSGAAGWHTVADIAAQPGPFKFDVSSVQFYRLPS